MLRALVPIAMAMVSIAMALLVMKGARAEDPGRVYSWRGEPGTSDSLRIYERPCEGKALAEVKKRANPVLWARFQAAVLVWHGKRYESCWVSIMGRVYSIDERGDPFGMSRERPYLPYEIFKPAVAT